MTAGPVREATVVRVDARGCLVRLDRPEEGLPQDGYGLWCAVRGVIHLRDRREQKSPVAVGDRVSVRRTQEDRGAVVGVHPRKSSLSRPAVRKDKVEHVLAANVDQVVIVSSVAEPEFSPGLVDRLLAVVEYSDLVAVLVVNKMDLDPVLPEAAALYRGLGYAVLPTSAKTGAGVDALRDALAHRVSVVTGHSGVGKSSLLNAVHPEMDLEVGEVNEVTKRGRHTTTATVWVPYGEDGALIDTAGIREFGLYGIPRRDLPWLFRDLAAIAPGCRYPDCLHRGEPGCAVAEAVATGRLARSRYDSYRRILDTI